MNDRPTPPAESAPNAELAYRVLDHIDAHPERHVQSIWITKTECGTAGCFAGWASMLSGDKPRWGRDSGTDTVVADRNVRYIGQRAIELLGITGDESDDLFDASNTREDLGRLVEEIFGPRPGGER